MSDLDTASAELNAAFEAARCPLIARAGQRAIKFFKVYGGELSGHGRAGYSIGRAEAVRIARSFDISLPA